MYKSPLKRSCSPGSRCPRQLHSPRGSWRVPSDRYGQWGGGEPAVQPISSLETLRRLQEDLRTGHTKELKLVLHRLHAVFKKIHDIVHPPEYLEQRTVRLNTRAIREIQTRVASLRNSILAMMVSYHVLDEATANDDRFAELCQQLFERMASYIILRDVASVSEIQDRESRTALSTFVGRLVPVVSDLFRMSEVIRMDGVEFTIEDLCNSLRYESLFDDGQSHYWDRSTQVAGGSMGKALTVNHFAKRNPNLATGISVAILVFIFPLVAVVLFLIMIMVSYCSVLLERRRT